MTAYRDTIADVLFQEVVDSAVEVDRSANNDRMADNWLIGSLVRTRWTRSVTLRELLQRLTLDRATQYLMAGYLKRFYWTRQEMFCSWDPLPAVDPIESGLRESNSTSTIPLPHYAMIITRASESGLTKM